MQFMENEISQVTEAVWTNSLGMPVQRSAGRSTAKGNGKTLAGYVRIKGGWEGAVVLRCPRELARLVAVVMFGINPETVAPEQILDAMGELVNITGCNLKALLPPPCESSLPIVGEETATSELVPFGQPLNEVSFDCMGWGFSVSLVSVGDVPVHGSGWNANRREFTRVSPRLGCVLMTEDETIYCGQIHDVSMNGISCECDADLPAGASCRVILSLGELDNSIQIEARGRVARSTESMIAVEFTEIDLDSYHHMRNLVLTNSASGDRAEFEMKHHLGIKGRKE